MLKAIAPILLTALVSSASFASPEDDPDLNVAGETWSTESSDSLAEMIRRDEQTPTTLRVSFGEFRDLSRTPFREREENLLKLARKHYPGPDPVMSIMAAARDGDPCAIVLEAMWQTVQNPVSPGMVGFREAAALGEPYAQYVIGQKMVRSRDAEVVRQGLELLDSAAECGAPEPMYTAARARLYGHEKVRDPGRAVEALKRGVELGSGESARSLGYLHEHGFHLPIDHAEAARLYQLGADWGDQHAKYNLALLLDQGKGITPDFPRAVELLRQLSDARFAQASWRLNRLYRTGDGVEVDKERAAGYLRLAANGGYEKAKVELARCLETGSLLPHIEHDRPAAARAYRSLLRSGNAEAHYRLGCMELEGRGVELDTNLGLEHIKVAAEKEYPAAMRRYGLALIEGEHLTRDIGGGMAIVRRAAELGDDEAAYRMGRFHDEGNHPDFAEQDYAKAAHYYEIGAAENHRGSLHDLGRLVVHGMGVPQDKARGLELIGKSAQQGSVNSEILLGKLYQFGKVIDKDVARARDHYQRAADAENPEGMRRLGRLLYEELAEREEGLKWVSKAAERGDVASKDWLAKNKK